MQNGNSGSYRLVRGAPLPEEEESSLPSVETLQAEAARFERSPFSNGYSNGAQSTGGVGPTAQAFECSNESPGTGEGDGYIIVDVPEEDET
jgi:hypothetical protein